MNCQSSYFQSYQPSVVKVYSSQADIKNLPLLIYQLIIWKLKMNKILNLQLFRTFMRSKPISRWWLNYYLNSTDITKNISVCVETALFSFCIACIFFKNTHRLVYHLYLWNLYNPNAFMTRINIWLKLTFKRNFHVGRAIIVRNFILNVRLASVNST